MDPYTMSNKEAMQWMFAACMLPTTRPALEAAFGKNNHECADWEGRSAYDVTCEALNVSNDQSPPETTFKALRRLFDHLGVNRMREVCFTMCSAEFYHLEPASIAQIFFFEGSEQDPFNPEYVEDAEDTAKREAYTENFVRLGTLWKRLRCAMCEQHVGTVPYTVAHNQIVVCSGCYFQSAEL